MEVKWRVEWPSTRQGVRSKIDQGALLARCQKQGLTLEMLAQKHPLGCEFHILRGAQATAFETLEPKFTVTVAETFFAKPNNLSLVNRFFQGRRASASVLFILQRRKVPKGFSSLFLIR